MSKKLPEKYKCIYCLRTIAEGATFKSREHVVPQSLGKFGANTFTLIGDVCDECNKQLGDDLDIVLARDSVEGLAFKELSKKRLSAPKGGQRVYLTLPDVPALEDFAGIYIDKNAFFNRFEYSQLSQVRLYEKGTNKKVTILHEQLKELDPLDPDKYEKKVQIFPTSDEDQKALIKLLHEKGIPFKAGGKLDIPKWKHDRVEFVATLDGIIKRALAKMAFEYAVYVYPDVDFTIPAYGNIREFVAKGKGNIVFQLPKSFLAQETDRIRAKTNGILIASQMVQDVLVVTMRLYDFQDYQIPIGKPGRQLKGVGYVMRPGKEPEPLYSSQRGSGLHVLLANYDPLHGPSWRDIRL